MAYVSLYRKYRPQTFADVVGQQHVTRTLQNAIEEDRLHHAYLFTGPRGTGKTSTARILAKAVNCEKGPTSTPCNDCEQCTQITTGASVDVIELDMASHGGVDDARDLRERARFAPASARKKVYILDEVHMASTAAFNALLKLIEEPPDHIIFAMATTDPQKVIPTIMSRVQRFDLRRVGAAEVAGHVREIGAGEGYEIEGQAVDAIVRAGEGSVRDTLSVLEQVLAYAGSTVTAEAVAQVLGQTPFERTAAAVDHVADSDLAGVMTLVQTLQDDGIDLRRFAFDLLQHLRDLLVLQAAPDHPDLVDATDERREQLADQAGRVQQDMLLHAVRLLQDAVTEMRLGPPRLPLELALATLANPATSGDLGALADRVARLEAGAPAVGQSTGEQLAERATSHAAETPVEEVEPETPEEESQQPEEAVEAAELEDTVPEAPEQPAPAATGEADFDTITERWEAILEIVKDTSRRIHAVYDPAEPIRLRNRILTLRYPRRYASFHADNAGKGQFSEALADAVEQATGQRVRVEAVVEGDTARRPQPPVVGADEPAAEAPEGPDPEEETAVREAELTQDDDGDPSETLQRAEKLVMDELDAEPVEDDTHILSSSQSDETD